MIPLALSTEHNNWLSLSSPQRHVRLPVTVSTFVFLRLFLSDCLSGHTSVLLSVCLSVVCPSVCLFRHFNSLQLPPMKAPLGWRFLSMTPSRQFLSVHLPNITRNIREFRSCDLELISVRPEIPPSHLTVHSALQRFASCPTEFRSNSSGNKGIYQKMRNVIETWLLLLLLPLLLSLPIPHQFYYYK